MNTVGKQGRLGESIRCVVSVSMLTEGWDANTVTHVLGVRAFGTQLLCEQVIGRALRRQSYDLNEDGLFNVEYADVLGHPVRLHGQAGRRAAAAAARDDPGQGRAPRARRASRSASRASQGYRVELPEERLTAEFNDDSVLELTPGPGRPVDHAERGDHRRGRRPQPRSTWQTCGRSTLLFHLTKRLLYTKWRDPGEEPEAAPLRPAQAHHAGSGSTTCLVCKGGTYPAQLMYQELADMACERITAGITRALVGRAPDQGRARPVQPHRLHRCTSTSTRRRRTAGRPTRAAATSTGSILDSDWEAEFCRVAEAHPRVRPTSRTTTSGFEVPYRYGSETRTYLPDFIVLVDDGHGDDDLLHLIVEIKGYRREDAKEKKATMETYWVPGVNNLGRYGRWAFAEFTEVYQIEADFEAKVEAEFNKMIDAVTAQPAA